MRVPANITDDVPTVIIMAVSPLPKVTSSVRRKTSRSGKPCIITSSPDKRGLELEKTKGPSSTELKKTKCTKKSEHPSKQSKKPRITTKERGPTPSTSGSGPSSSQGKVTKCHQDQNAQCLYCNENFSDSVAGEIWIQCPNAKNGPTKTVPDMRSEILYVKFVLPN